MGVGFSSSPMAAAPYYAASPSRSVRRDVRPVSEACDKRVSPPGAESRSRPAPRPFDTSPAKESRSGPGSAKPTAARQSRDRHYRTKRLWRVCEVRIC
jgi:hypothetical protein